MDYYREMLICIMDNLNLLYVAMTRAVNNLFIIMPYQEEKKALVTVAELIQSLIENPMFPDSIDKELYIDFGKHWDSVNRVFESGIPMAYPKQEDLPQEEIQTQPLILHSNSKRLKIRLHSKDYFRLTGDSRTERINRGTVMHQIFEKIRTVQDVGKAVNQMVVSGMITSAEGKEIEANIEGLLSQQPFSEWFSDQWRVLNERDILRVGESKHRPDRVMLRDHHAVVIDYKTGEKSDKDLRQMKGYLADLFQMGYSSCEGNIWYLQNNELVKVEK